ncbi:hypothetical protein Tco_0927136 [Tanacetum coccineum]|uniref:Uncharacterized protein n=1 Tax=Tanacetum coccineum TaxID=301880 RepID=A0ABQ5DCQ6_9ASTR
MASLDCRLNSLYAIKECSYCGNLHTKDCGCSIGSLEDKILVPVPDLSQRPLKIEKNCLDCGDPVHGLYCRQCALIRKTLEEVFQDFQDTSKSSDDDTDFVNQDPFVVKQGPGVNSSQSPLQINHNCCYECGDSLDDIFYQRCTCKSCGKEEQVAKDRHWKIPVCYDDNDDYTIAIIPVLPTKEPVNSLSMGDEHLDTILATESDKVIKSSVENLVPIPSESEGIPNSVCDVPLCNNLIPLEAFKEHSETINDSNNDSSLSDDDSYENIDYVNASPPDAEIVSLEVVEIVIPEVGGIDTDILLTIKDDTLHEKLLNVNLIIANIEALKDNLVPYSDFVTKSSSTSLNLFLEETNTFDNSSPESETFCFDLEEISSGSTTTRSDDSLPDYEAFYDDHIKEKSSGSTTTHANFSQYDSFIFDLSINPIPPADRSDFYHEEFAGELVHIISPPEYDHFCFKIEPELGNLTMDVVEDILPTREPRVHVPNVLPTHPTLNLDFTLSSEPLFAYIVWIFLPFLTIVLDSEASRARGFVLLSQELQILSFILGIRYPNLID